MSQKYHVRTSLVSMLWTGCSPLNDWTWVFRITGKKGELFSNLKGAEIEKVWKLREMCQSAIAHYLAFTDRIYWKEDEQSLANVLKEHDFLEAILEESKIHCTIPKDNYCAAAIIFNRVLRISDIQRFRQHMDHYESEITRLRNELAEVIAKHPSMPSYQEDIINWCWLSYRIHTTEQKYLLDYIQPNIEEFTDEGKAGPA